MKEIKDTINAKISHVHGLIYIFNAISIKIPKASFRKIEKNPKIHMELKKKL